MNLRTAALEYAARGWRVFPLRGKTPLVAGGFKAATTSYRQIEAWWFKYPVANIGFDIPEGMLVLDFDPRNGAPAPVTLGLPWTRRVLTPGGGEHRYYTVPEDLTFVGRYPDTTGVDVKAAGKGYVLLPPSTDDNGREYQWALPLFAPIAPLSAHIVDSLARKPRAISSATPGVRRFFGRPRLYGLVKTVREAQEGERNRILYWATCKARESVAEGYLDEDDTLRSLLDAALYVGLGYDEAMATMESAYRAEGA